MESGGKLDSSKEALDKHSRSPRGLKPLFKIGGIYGRDKSRPFQNVDLIGADSWMMCSEP